MAQLKYTGHDALSELVSKTKTLVNAVKGTAESAASSAQTASAEANWLGTSNSVATSTKKIVTCEGFTLKTGAKIAVTFKYANTAESITMTVNSSAEKSVICGDATSLASSWTAGETCLFVYDGTNWNLLKTIGASGVTSIDQGGTGATTAADARTNLGITLANLGAAAASHSHSASDITSGSFGVTRGGTGRTTLTSGSYLIGAGTSQVDLKTPSEVLSDIGAAAASHTHTLASLGAAASDHSHTLESLGAAAASHGHAASDITSGTFGVARGGTGQSTLTSGYYLVGNGTSAVTMKKPADVLTDIGAAAASHSHTAADVGAAAADHSHTLGSLGAAAASHTHAASDITSGSFGVARGGTGRATLTANAVLTGNGTTAVNMVGTASGALYATAANGAPSFGTLPVAQGGTGATSAANARTNLGITPANIGAAASSHSHALTDCTGTLTIAKGGTGATSAAAALKALGGATVVTYTASINTSWTANSSGGYYKSVTVSGILATDTPVVGIQMSNDVSAATLQGKAFACVNRIVTAANSITLYAFSTQPTTAFTLQLLCVRAA